MRISELKKAIREMIVGELNEVEFQSKSGELDDVKARVIDNVVASATLC
jgi:hypothetical protein